MESFLPVFNLSAWKITELVVWVSAMFRGSGGRCPGLKAERTILSCSAFASVQVLKGLDAEVSIGKRSQVFISFINSPNRIAFDQISVH